ncbi:unnamed protein product [Linum tenue]|uniref:Chlororespiratory reduction 41 n=1 Tax=Linum tenue TaxID=586396 RepID=A0AAV0H4A7_9ROSI|nr:unnamed protein product [Linum tenue]CAI0380151.1 unnamed protein product [Linum tenue]
MQTYSVDIFHSFNGANDQKSIKPYLLLPPFSIVPWPFGATLMASTHIPSLSSLIPLLQSNRFCSKPPLAVFTLITQKSRNPPAIRPINCSSTTNGAAANSELNETSLDNATTTANGSLPEPALPFSTTLNNSNFPIEKRRRSEILRERRKSQSDLLKPDGPPPNYEVGWRRTKEIKVEKPVGYMIMDFLEKLEGLMEREFGSTQLLAKVGEIVAERAREEAELLKDEGKVEERMVTELFRVLRLMEMDLAMVKAAVKEETLEERLEQAKARCRQAILVANSF